jgi:lysyl-tRNA synthetase class 2
MLRDEHRRLSRIKPNLERRASITHFTRAFFKSQGFLEVETPIRVPTVAPELHIIPFDSESWFLSTSPELYMKRLLTAGYGKIFQISHCFRKGERGQLHNPEFTMLEWYRTGADYLQMVSDTEQLVMTLIESLELDPVIHYKNQNIDLALPWPRITLRDAFLDIAGWDPVANPDPDRFDLDLVDRVIPGFNSSRPVVLLDYPSMQTSMARSRSGEPGVAERAEVFIGGLELANAYSELINVQELEERFQDEIERIQREQGRAIAMPRRFLEAVTDLPECGGIALGMDRLVMLLCDAESMEEVMFFTVDTA